MRSMVEGAPWTHEAFLSFKSHTRHRRPYRLAALGTSPASAGEAENEKGGIAWKTQRQSAGCISCSPSRR